MDNDIAEVECFLCGKKFETTLYETIIDGAPIMMRSHSFCSKDCTKKFTEQSGQKWDGERR